ncbi:Coiled-coil domain-containing protein 180 [Stylophora pistillata]|uniref:Coiled-coil domain-containing protein 180 n=1 Tax=Stylophora pistillata TaxID=50429 RepID=A0A2B4RH60_STYPI|nr:Coiled-coil domain-containing protein 180 [Stylophora pistillata]
MEFQCVKYLKGKDAKEMFSLAYLGFVPINLCLGFIWIRFGVLLYREVRKKWFSSETRGGGEIRDTCLARETEIAHMKELLNPGSISFQIFDAVHFNNAGERLDNLSGGIEAGLVFSAVISILMLLHFMKCHRENSKKYRIIDDVQKGRISRTPDNFLLLSTRLNLGKSLRYSGYQIAFSLIGFFMLSIYLSFVAIALAIIFKGPEEVLGVKIWEALKDAGVAFMQLFSILSYFFFFYNIIVGLTSCTIRILKGMLLGVIFISRIDRTSLIQGFQSWDKAFVAYVGFVTVLVAHRHPVMLVFCQLLIDRKSDQQSQEERE